MNPCGATSLDQWWVSEWITFPYLFDSYFALAPLPSHSSTLLIWVGIFLNAPTQFSYFRNGLLQSIEMYENGN